MSDWVCVGPGALIMKGYCCRSDSVNLHIVLSWYLPCWGESGKPTWQHSLPTARHLRLTHTHTCCTRISFQHPSFSQRQTTAETKRITGNVGEKNLFFTFLSVFPFHLFFIPFEVYEVLFKHYRGADRGIWICIAPYGCTCCGTRCVQKVEPR